MLINLSLTTTSEQEVGQSLFKIEGRYSILKIISLLGHKVEQSSGIRLIQMYIFAPKIEPAEYFFDCTSIHLIMIRQKYGLILESRLHTYFKK